MDAAAVARSHHCLCGGPTATGKPQRLQSAECHTTSFTLSPVSRQFCRKQHRWLQQKQQRLDSRRRPQPSGSLASRGSQADLQAFLSDIGRIERSRGRRVPPISSETADRGGYDSTRSRTSRWQGSAAASLASMAPTAPQAPVAPEGNAVQEATERVGVLLLNLGGPETLDDVQPFLFNLFADPDIIRLPRNLRFLQRPLAQFISSVRAPKSAEGYAAIGGGSPLRRITNDQAQALQESLEKKGCPAHVYVGMRYWHPFTEEAIFDIKQDRITRLVVLPLYPQFSISTSGSSLRLLERLFREDDYLVQMEHTVIPSWYQRSGYVKAMANLIEEELQKLPVPEEAHIFFSAHGVPVTYVEDAGDPYKAEMEECIALITQELEDRGVDNKYTLAYQSRVGPVEWLKPYTDETIKKLGKEGVKSLLAVPISFVSEHIETLEEIDVEYRELALASGIVHWGRVPALGVEPMFIDDLADAVLEALPFVGAMAMSSVDAKQALVPLGSVEELLATYDTLRRELPAPVAVWEWGWTKSAETWNGRIAMIAVLALLILEVTTGQGVLHQWGMLPPKTW
ncbi:ferrochelatase [Klebsormidium nitens]|uniref:Ferrochelatase n=1 Tax=Klebsormidium nitens TaxID=105231 RepID=A0A1Y1IFI4_KLENI|nr:ferrochelatase [Klebsormidium nitens]|eukprot:GAQ89635.1 ferrochelatase [Klebsormidium nitens]